MNIGILIFSEPSLEKYSSADRLVQAGEAMGHNVVKLYEPHLSFYKKTISHDGEPLPSLDVIIARPNFIEEPSLRLHVIESLMTRYRVINGLGNISASKNKITQHLLFEKNDLQCPSWGLARRSQDVRRLAETIGYPVILKVAFGTHGKGVFYAPDQETIDPIAEYLSIRDGNPMIVEGYVSEAQRKDLRIFVLGGEVLTAMERQAPDGDIRANTSTGGVGTKVELTDEEIDLAKRAAAVFNLEIAGVDLIRSDKGPLILEINSNPGFKELERVTGTDVAKAIIEYAIK
jgi:ribosomal protein S6--L-glutamate ligase